MEDAGTELRIQREPPTLATDGNHPIPMSQRTFSTWDFTSLWFGMVINIPSFYLAGGLVDMGMSWWQGIATIFIANTILLVPLILTGEPGTSYGIPFPVLLRSAFGVRGAFIPALLRAVVACGWCSIESWIGGKSIFLLLPSSMKASSYGKKMDWLGTSVLEFSCFIIFSLIQLAILWKGMDGLRVLEKYSAPILTVLVCWLFAWACIEAGGLGEILFTPSRLGPSEFWSVFFPSLNAGISNWAGLTISIPDFTRHAKSRTDQAVGQLGLPVFMAAFSFVGLTVVSTTQVIFGRVISDPVELVSTIGGALTHVVVVFGIVLAIVTTNIPANFITVQSFLISLSPSAFAAGPLMTVAISVAFLPWRILQSSESFMYTWLGGCSTILAPVAGIVLVDYYVLNRMKLDLEELYSTSPLGRYYYSGGYNLAAMAALLVSVGVTAPGFLQEAGVVESTFGVFVGIYDNAWLFGFSSAAILYWAVSLLVSGGRRRRRRKVDSSSSCLLDPLQADGRPAGDISVS